jgi:signal transduction histidine kinase
VTTRRWLGAPTIRAALLLGFGLTLGLWLFAGYQLGRRMVEVQNDAAAISARYMHSQELLSTVRAQVLLGSVYVRDALLDPDTRTAAEYRRRLEDTYRSIDVALHEYLPVFDSSAERERLERLRHGIDDFRATMLEVLSDSSRRPSEARLLLQNRVVPKREVVIRVSEEVQVLNRTAFVKQQSDIAEVYRATQRRVWQQLGLALAASLGIGLVATRYAGRLEKRIRRQMAKEAETARDLQRLSSRIISAQEDERRAIARELHDEVGQVLTAIKVELAIAQRSIEGTPGGADVLGPARSIADGALQTVRDLSQLLHPAILDDLGLPAAIDRHLKEFGKRHGIRVDLLQDRMEDRLAPETEATAYRIVQEALTNVARHARAQICRVYLQRLPRTVLVTIEDDGIGFESTEGSTDPRRGLGLIGVRERVAHLRGTMRLESGSGKGTRLTVELPARTRKAPTDVDETKAADLAAEAVDEEVV